MQDGEPVVFLFLDRYLWFIGIPLAAIQTIFMWLYGRSSANSPINDADEWRRFCFMWFGVYAVTFLGLGFFQFLGSFASFTFITSQDHGDLYVLGARVWLLMIWTVMAVWIVNGGGAEILAAHPRRWRNNLPGRLGSKSPFAIKLQFCTIIIMTLGFLVVLILSGGFSDVSGKRL